MLRPRGTGPRVHAVVVNSWNGTSGHHAVRSGIWLQRAARRRNRPNVQAAPAKPAVLGACRARPGRPQSSAATGPDAGSQGGCPMRRPAARIARAILPALWIGALPTSAAAGQVDYARAEQLLTWNAARLITGDVVAPNWLADGTRFSYRSIRCGRRSFTSMTCISVTEAAGTPSG